MRTQGILATFIGLLGFLTFTVLLFKGIVGTASYIALLSLLTFVCLVIPVLDRLKHLDIKNLKLTLEKIESVKKEIYAKESDLRQTSLLLTELIAANASVAGIWGDDESEKYSKALVRSKIMHLAKQLRLTSKELDMIFKYDKALADVNNASKDEHGKKWNEFIELLKNESAKSS